MVSSIVLWVFMGLLLYLYQREMQLERSQVVP
jgi:hypothetical protein